MSLPFALFDDAESSSDSNDSEIEFEFETSPSSIDTPCPPSRFARTPTPSPRITSSVRRIRDEWFTTHVRGIILHTETMMLRGNLPQFEPINIRSTDGLFELSPATLSEIFEIPLIARKLFIKDRPDLKDQLRVASCYTIILRRHSNLFSLGETACDRCALIIYPKDSAPIANRVLPPPSRSP